MNLHDKLALLNAYIKDESLKIKITDIYGKREIQMKDLSRHNEVFVSIQFFDSIKTETRDCKGFPITSCSESKIFDHERDSIKSLLLDINASVIAFNRYSKGSHLEFMLSNKVIDESLSVYITMPGIGSQSISVGDEVFVASVRDDEQLGKLTLTEIKNNDDNLSLVFDNGYEIDLFTRGHIAESIRILHRVDYHIIAKDLKSFTGYTFQYGGSHNRDSDTLKNLKAILDYSFSFGDL